VREGKKLQSRKEVTEKRREIQNGKPTGGVGCALVDELGCQKEGKSSSEGKL